MNTLIDSRYPWKFAHAYPAKYRIEIIEIIKPSMIKNRNLAAVGFEPTPPRRLVPKTSALDHSATLPDMEA